MRPLMLQACCKLQVCFVNASNFENVLLGSDLAFMFSYIVLSGRTLVELAYCGAIALVGLMGHIVSVTGHRNMTSQNLC